ncbi:MAG TPA: hypothetical protein VF465_18685 [Flavobacterium sp.]|uniref:hypothetical protein n=1 Tax=Flavobacterium sp. TaxID=239 RepID=UPI002ED3839D
MIYIFKTSVDTKLKLELATTRINQLLPMVKWNFDLEDCDNILRIDSDTDICDIIIQNGVFECVELN